MAGAVLREVQVSPLVAGAVFGEMCKDRRSAKCCIFQSKCARRAGKVTSVAQQVANMLGSFSDRARTVNDVSAVFNEFLSNLAWSFCVAGAVLVMLEGDTCCSAPCK